MEVFGQSTLCLQLTHITGGLLEKILQTPSYLPSERDVVPGRYLLEYRPLAAWNEVVILPRMGTLTLSAIIAIPAIIHIDIPIPIANL